MCHAAKLSPTPASPLRLLEFVESSDARSRFRQLHAEVVVAVLWSCLKWIWSACACCENAHLYT